MKRMLHGRMKGLAAALVLAMIAGLMSAGAVMTVFGEESAAGQVVLSEDPQNPENPAGGDPENPAGEDPENPDNPDNPEDPVIPDGIHDGKYYKDGVVWTGEAPVYVTFEAKLYKVETTGDAALHTGKYSGKYYKKGVLAKGWLTLGERKYYCKAGVPFKGKKKISKKWYLFKGTGVMATADTKYRKVMYYLNKNNNVEAYKKGKVYYKPNGKKMSAAVRDDYTTLRTARKIVKKITTSDMTQKQKLKVCFDYIIKMPYKRYRMPFPAGNKSWVSLYANDHLIRKGGDCHADAAAFGYLARACGYKTVYICLDAKLANPTHHAWTKVGSRYYDPLFAEAKNYNKYWDAKSYPLTAITTKKIAPGYVGAK